MKKKKYSIKIGFRKEYLKEFKTHHLIAFYDREKNQGLLAWSPNEKIDDIEVGELLIAHLVSYLSMLSLIPNGESESGLLSRKGFPFLIFFTLQWARKEFNPSIRKEKGRTNLPLDYEEQLEKSIEKALKTYFPGKKIDVL